MALVLVPQSMAYAQLAGLPAYYGLYAAFLPPMIAALFGSSRQLATGPVAVVSLMTATALEPFATAGSESFIIYAVLLALMVGVFQLLLGVLKLGLVVNFLSHPVVNGFTNAAAIIIATSQLSKLFGVYVDKAEHHYETIINVILAAFDYTHLPTLALGALAFLIMIVLKRINPRIPSVLVAVIVCTLISWAIGFDKTAQIDINRIKTTEVVDKIRKFNTAINQYEAKSQNRVETSNILANVVESQGLQSREAIRLKYEMTLIQNELSSLKEEIIEMRAELRSLKFSAVKDDDNELVFFLENNTPENVKIDSYKWRIKAGNKALPEENLPLLGGGAVVGTIPSGLPGMKAPTVDFSMVTALFPMAIIISLLGFMEAISIAKAMAAKTGQRLDPNQELIGQGLANIIGSCGQSYAVSGSFSRSAVNIQAGAQTGMSNVFSSAVVLIVLLFFTPLLYHLPQAVLAAIIMMAVFGLINVSGFIHAWKVQRYDGLIGIISFVTTLAFAPHLDRGILIGVTLSLILLLLRGMKPETAHLSLHPDGTYRNTERFDLEECPYISMIRYNGSVYFANVNYLEELVLSRINANPELKHIILVGNGINELDSSGEEMLSLLVDRFRESDIGFSITGLNDNVIDAMRRTHLYEKIGEENMYRNATRAINAVHQRVHEDIESEEACPIVKVHFKRYKVPTQAKQDPRILKEQEKHPDSSNQDDSD